MPLSFMAAPTSVDADAPILEAPERRRDAFVDRFFRAAKPLGSRSGDADEAAAAPAHLLAAFLFNFVFPRQIPIG